MDAKGYEKRAARAAKLREKHRKKVERLRPRIRALKAQLARPMKQLTKLQRELRVAVYAEGHYCNEAASNRRYARKARAEEESAITRCEENAGWRPAGADL